MKKYHLAYVAYLLILLGFVGAVILTPFLAFTHDMRFSYSAFGPLCHQKISRSFCIFSDGKGYWIGDCTPQEGSYVASATDRETIEVQYGSIHGFKMPLCARCTGVYTAMLLGALVYPLVHRLDDKRLYPAIYLVLAMVPIAIDGGIQFASELGILPFVYESTNLIRLLTGGIAGFAASFYALSLFLGFAMALKNQEDSSGSGQQRS